MLKRIFPFLLSVLFLTEGCTTLSCQYSHDSIHLQITRGRSVPPVDLLGTVLSFPMQLILWNWRFNNHCISSETEKRLIQYLEARNLSSFEDTLFRLNEYDPVGDLKALFKNRHVAWPYRFMPGFFVTLIFDVLLPGRLFPLGDYFNPFTNVAHLYSDDFAIAYHEAGHAWDQANFSLKGTYALIRVFFLVTLYQEWWATDEAIDYLIEIGDREGEFRAYRTLWPAYGTYLGGAIPVPYVGGVIGALGGHIAAAVKVSSQKKYYKRMDDVLNTPGLGSTTAGVPAHRPKTVLKGTHI